MHYYPTFYVSIGPYRGYVIAIYILLRLINANFLYLSFELKNLNFPYAKFARCFSLLKMPRKTAKNPHAADKQILWIVI